MRLALMTCPLGCFLETLIQYSWLCHQKHMSVSVSLCWCWYSLARWLGPSVTAIRIWSLGWVISFALVKKLQQLAPQPLLSQSWWHGGGSLAVDTVTSSILDVARSSHLMYQQSWHKCMHYHSGSSTNSMKIFSSSATKICPVFHQGKNTAS